MHHDLLALALAAASLVYTVPGHADTPSADGYHGHDRQTCITRRTRLEDHTGKTVTKRVRICR